MDSIKALSKASILKICKFFKFCYLIFSLEIKAFLSFSQPFSWDLSSSSKLSLISHIFFNIYFISNELFSKPWSCFSHSFSSFVDFLSKYFCGFFIFVFDIFYDSKIENSASSSACWSFSVFKKQFISPKL